MAHKIQINVYIKLHMLFLFHLNNLEAIRSNDEGHGLSWYSNGPSCRWSETPMG